METHTPVKTDPLDTTKLQFSPGKKVKPIKAKPINSILVDDSVVAKFLLDTLEGTQMLKANSMVCVGEVGDVWQQDCDKLHKAYTPTYYSPDGWCEFEPKPENERDICEITLGDCEIGEGEFVIEAQWGTRQSNGKFLQTGKSGDFIARSQEDPSDVWIIDRKVFLSTYSWNNHVENI